jgi:hypothetical protein
MVGRSESTDRNPARSFVVCLESFTTGSSGPGGVGGGARPRRSDVDASDPETGDPRLIGAVAEIVPSSRLSSARSEAKRRWLFVSSRLVRGCTQSARMGGGGEKRTCWQASTATCPRPVIPSRRAVSDRCPHVNILAQTGTGAPDSNPHLLGVLNRPDLPRLRDGGLVRVGALAAGLCAQPQVVV